MVSLCVLVQQYRVTASSISRVHFGVSLFSDLMVICC